LTSGRPTSWAFRLRAFHQGLKETGFGEGENLSILYRLAENRSDQLAELAADLVHREVAVIVTGGVPAAFAAKAATTTIPTVFVVAQDPVSLGLVASLARPGGNLTGVNLFNAELTAKRLELLRELVPKLRRVAVLVHPADTANTESTLQELQAAAGNMGLQIEVRNANSSREINADLVGAGEHGRRDFLKGMQDLGYVEGHNFDMVYRFSDVYQDRLRALAEEIIRLNPSAILGAAVGAVAAMIE